MSRTAPVAAFAGYGIELEYMIVDRDGLAVRPIADALLRDATGHCQAEVARGEMGWSNELALHVLEVKNRRPQPDLGALAVAFQDEVRELDRRLAPLDARLMPGAMHPWMDPAREGRLWPHEHAALYRRYDRIFDCRRHGWMNLQSMHVNLPFADDAEFARLHAAVRLVLPILPALAASSPFADGRFSGHMDYRMEAYRTHQLRLPATIGEVIPDNAGGRADYQARILAPMYDQLAPLDPGAVLHHEWLNARGAIARFDRSAIEIRVIDLQECPRADLAVAAATIHVVRRLYECRWSSLADQLGAGTAALVRLLRACSRDAERARIDDEGFLALLGWTAGPCEAGALWRHLLAHDDAGALEGWREPLQVMLDSGPLARRLLRAAGADCDRTRLEAVYRNLCDALAAGRMFLGPDRAPLAEAAWPPTT